MAFSGALRDFATSVASLTKQILYPQSFPELHYRTDEDWGRWEARRARYALYWAFWNQSVYDDEVHWQGNLKALFDLYRATRCNYNPMYRLGEFWATTLWGGKLSNEVWGGRVIQSAIPIITDDAAVREAIGQLWVDSRWQTEKTIVCRYGAVKGDFGIKLHVDLEAGKVRIVPVNPDTVRWVLQDPATGIVHAYEICEPRWDPRFDPKTGKGADGLDGGPKMVLYTERCYLEDGKTVFETLLGDAPYPWNGRAVRWSVPYGFVPLVWQPHVQMHPGYYFGASELQNGIYKAMELDDVSSKQHDHIRKASDPKWFFSGARKPDDNVSRGALPDANHRRPGSQETPAIWVPTVGATAYPMVFNVDNQFVSIEIQNQLAAFEKDYPELRYDSARASGDASAKALREVRKSAEAKVHDRRTNYDEALVRIQEMALAVGGFHRFDKYPFTLEQYRGGGLRHKIGERSVFLMDPLDRTEEEQALATAWQTFKLAGWPDKQIIDRLGDFNNEGKAKWLADKLEETALALQQQMLLKAAAPAPQGGPA